MKTPWFGDSAQWLDSCTTSVNQQLTVKDYEVAKAISSQNVLGGTEEDGPGCWQFALWNKWTPYLAEYGSLFADSLMAAQN